MTALGALLGIVGAFLALGPAALALGRSSKATPIVYGASLLIAISGLAVAAPFFLLARSRKRWNFRSACLGSDRISGWTRCPPFLSS